MFWIRWNCLIEAILTNNKNMFPKVFQNTVFLHNFLLTVTTQVMVSFNQIIVLTKFVVVLSVLIKRIDCTNSSYHWQYLKKHWLSME